jgi:hypothetical protein
VYGIDTEHKTGEVYHHINKHKHAEHNPVHHLTLQNAVSLLHLILNDCVTLCGYVIGLDRHTNTIVFKLHSML